MKIRSVGDGLFPTDEQTWRR